MSTVVLSSAWATANMADHHFWGDNDVWNKGSLTIGKDFTQSVSFDTSNSPDGTVLSWSWPQTGTGNNVYSMPCIIYGTQGPWYQNGAPQGGTVLPPSTQIDNFAALSVTYSITNTSQTPKNFDNLLDMFLTAGPHG